ncbi:hypothetical protein MTX78_01135 [Hymenobacter tibetensis]|uniref:Uncharacterized protein n=1 Tax=Hymenobacter tibetensis TaxID=497967 RepID=A0ABY4CY67_9BACT|nr:hypothetical protein [Hymenobacter tibetensis]UOG75215.1 hypothetical protein MTX78_01135 [Hymenobacter tibetensis]
MKTLLFAAFLVAASVGTSFAQTQAPAASDGWDTPSTAPAVEEQAPQYSMGWNTAPGQSLSLHGRPTTDYWGRPLKKKSKNLTTAPAKEVAYAEESADPMMQSSGVMVAPGMSSSPYRGVSTDYWGRPIKKKAIKNSSVVAQTAEKTTPVTTHTTTGW